MAELVTILRKTSAEQQVYQTKFALLRKARMGKPNVDTAVLKTQIQAFQLLSRGLDVPDYLQETLIKTSGTASDNEDQPLFAPVDIDQDFEERVLRAGVPPPGGFPPPQSVTDSCEKIISNRITSRLTELERLPANLGTLDVHNLNFDPSYKVPDQDDALKIRALLEYKSLMLLTKQKSLRQHIVFNLASRSDPVSESMTRRFSNRRVRVKTVHDVRLSEQIEIGQRMNKERQVRDRKIKELTAFRDHAHQVNLSTQNRKLRNQAMGRGILNLHNTIQREEAKRGERTAKQRLQALRANDEEAYIKLLDQTKDTRITHLLKQTNSFLDSLTKAVKVQQGDMTTTIDDDPENKEKIDYYKVAHRIKEEVKEQPSILVGGKLKEYQIKGLQWMVSLYNNNLNGILADEMGLGKTIQSISLITYLIEKKREIGPYLVIVPLSTLTNWTLEFEKWAPGVKTIVYKGNPTQRRELQNQIRMGDFQVLLTTFEYIIKDRPILSRIRWVHMIMDEGHRMKNTQSKLSYTLTTYYTFKHRLILTGTPLQNNLPELWALLNFVLPKIFNSVKSFDEWFNTPFANTGSQDKMELTEEESLLIIRRLHIVLRPFLLRRLKKDVEKDLPDKVENVIRCKMSILQAKLYEQMIKHNVLFVGSSTKTGMKGLNNRIMQLKKICNHPFVFDEVENLVNPNHETNDNIWRVAGKFELLDRILPKFKRTGHRVLMFFQMTQVMDIMEDYLRLREHTYMRLDGTTKADDRSALLKEFNAPDSPYFMFLLSTRAGGLGLNLQTADTVIIFDSDWNPHQDLQAQDRAHRIGQTKEVRIIRLVTEDSVEEAILSRAHAKLEIDGKVIQAGKFDNKSTAEEQEAFLRSILEAEEVRKRSTSNERDDEMDDEELNEILARSNEEAILFNEMDKERYELEGPERERLITLPELPAEYQRDIDEIQEEIANKKLKEVETLGRGTRRGNGGRVYYDDGLTEEQWLNAVDKDAETLEQVMEKQRLKMDRKREKRKSTNATSEEEADAPTLEATPEDYQEEEEDEEEEEEAEEEEVPVKAAPIRRRSKRGSATPVATTPEPPRKRRRGTVGRVETPVKADSEEPAETDNDAGAADTEPTTLLAKTTQLIESLRGLTVTDSNGDVRSRTELFETLPDRAEYPDYYDIIKKPVALATVLAKAKAASTKGGSGSSYKLLTVKNDLIQMCRNAMRFNEQGSDVYTDAEVIRAEVEKWYKQNK
ncbi:hypothetical protein DV495_004511 [Geotrichum candidum]|nr:hypothetical protein DV495_004511 [Geotrichum candidum]